MLTFARFLFFMAAEEVFQMAAPASRILAIPEAAGSGGIEDLFDLPTNFIRCPRLG